MKQLHKNIYGGIRVMAGAILVIWSMECHGQGLQDSVTILNDTIEIGTIREAEASTAITVAGDNTTVLVDGDGSTGGHLILQAGEAIYLRSGFWAKRGASFVATVDKSLAISPDTTLTHTLQHNGNISAIRWKGHTDIKSHAFSYGYDPMGRIKSGYYAKENAGSYTQHKGRYSIPEITYDANGNIQSLMRQGTTDDGKHRVIDKLAYGYWGGSNKLQYVQDTAYNDLGFKDGAPGTSADYTYDANGNMITDANKGILQIEYNYLNLPRKVIFETDGDSVVYIYDAAGTKLQQKVYEGGQLKTKRDYISGVHYVNDTLAFIQHEEGRVLSKEGNWDYQFHIKDHLGNIRATVSNSNEVYRTVETMETGENSGFGNINHHVNANANTTLGGDEVDLLTAQTIGAMVMVSVMKRDTVWLSVQANYETAPATNNLLGILASALFSSFDLGIGGGETSAAMENEFNEALAGAGMAGKNGSSTAPMAFLNYIYFDEEMNYVSAGYKQISTAAQGIGVHEMVSLTEPVVADRNGYILAYLSNENTEPVNVHFDDFTVTQATTNVVQSDDYYPFGLTFNSYTSGTENKYLFQGQEHQDETGWDQFRWRNHDPAIGRFFNIDPLAESFYYNSPYAFAENKVIDHIELEGLEGIQIHEFNDNDELTKIVYQLDIVVVTNSGGDNPSGLSSSDVSDIEGFLGNIFGGSFTDPESGVEVGFEFNVSELDKSTTKTKRNGKEKTVAGDFSDKEVNLEVANRSQKVDDGTRSAAALIFEGNVPGTDGGRAGSTVKFDRNSPEGAQNAFGHEVLHFMLDRHKGDDHRLGGLLGRPIRGKNINKAILKKLKENVPRSSSKDRR